MSNGFPLDNTKVWCECVCLDTSVQCRLIDVSDHAPETRLGVLRLISMGSMEWGLFEVARHNQYQYMSGGNTKVWYRWFAMNRLWMSLYGVEWRKIHLTTYDEKVWLYKLCSVASDTAPALPLQRVPSSSSTIQESLSRRLLLVESCLSMALSFLSCVSTFFDTVSGVARLRPGSGGSTSAIPVSSNRLATIELCDNSSVVLVARHNQYQYEGDGDVGGGEEDTKVWCDPRTAVDYCLRFYLYPDHWSAMNCLRMSLSASPATLLLCHGPECSGSRRAPGESMAVVQSPWRPWTPTDSHAKEERAHMRGGPAKKRTKRKEQAPPRGGPSSRSMQMVTTQGLER
ncbi:uncharacterized protein UDID_19145 [Ustilago sp. UG-2017a]|nr:uncharacterized protein UDID_19145 [Ustilago sp. UG-2017a]